jgi:hypothetical protein
MTADTAIAAAAIAVPTTLTAAAAAAGAVIPFQVIINIGTSHSARGGSEYPYLFQQIVQFLEAFVNADIFDILHIDCYVRDKGELKLKIKS